MTAVTYGIRRLMPRYTQATWITWQQYYRAAARTLVATGGWQALGIRAVGVLAGKTGTAVNKIFSEQTLQTDLVEQAFLSIEQALAPYRSARLLDPGDLHRRLLEALRADPLHCRAMLQVAAQASVQQPAGPRSACLVPSPVAVAVRTARSRAIDMVRDLVSGPALPRHQAGTLTHASEIVDWYLSTCLKLVVDPEVTDDALLADAGIGAIARDRVEANDRRPRP